MNAEYIHPHAPPKLVKAYRKTGSYHKLADEIDVNVSYVYKLITEGKEPNDTTPKLREIRHRLGLKKRKPRDRPKPQKTPIQKAIATMQRSTHEAIRKTTSKPARPNPRP